jgi:asparagine synthase (glutamine-hydrolysing)
MKVMLDGQGSDEYLAGYEPSFSRVIAGQLRSFRFLSAWRALNWPSSRRRGRRRMAKNSLRAALWDAGKLYTGYYQSQCFTLGVDRPPEFELRKVRGSPLKQYLYHALLTTSLPAMLHYQDRIAMLFSIENRVPFLDHRLIEFVHSLDDEDLVFLGQTKYILRAALKPFLPPAITARADKQKFSLADVGPWLNGPFRYLLEKPLDFDRLSMLNPQKTEALIDQFKHGGRVSGKLVWRLAVLQRWLETQ